ncbi:MAG: UbiA family prenyltransferase [Deltaproteobacteria bacterium]|nr:UbiA family prenyltransferase [Deltaproteobacteria bacterium]
MARRLLDWINERFPLPNGILFFVLYFTALVTGRFSTTTEALPITASDLVGFIALWSFFLMLRVFDEHKDYELDCQNYPDRVLQSGRITLGHLKVVGAVAIILQLGISLWLDAGFGRIAAWWLAVFIYSLLMAKEFFVGEWLNRRLLLYAATHMVVMPLAMIWLAQIGAEQSALPRNIGLLAGLSFMSGASFEITRKLRGPEEERDGVDSYTKVLGTSGAPLLVVALLGGSTVVQVLLLHWIFGGPARVWWYGVLAAGLLPGVITLLRFRAKPTAATRKASEGAVSLSMLMSYLVVVIAVWSERGLSWS